jgi:hypothetical protein
MSDPLDPIQTAHSAMLEGDYNRALGLWNTIRPKLDGLAAIEAELHSLQCMTQLGQESLVVRRCEALIGAHPDDLSEYTDLGQYALQVALEAALELEDLDQAVDLADAALSALFDEPTCCDALTIANTAQKRAHLARALERHDESEEALALAIQSLEKARKSASSDPPRLKSLQLMEAELYLCRAENRIAGSAAEIAEFDLKSAIKLYKKSGATKDPSAGHARTLLKRLQAGEFSQN